MTSHPPSGAHVAPIASREIVAIASRRLPSLDGLRALSITLVLISHALPHDLTPHSKLAEVAIAIADNGNFGVQIFFVISGFLITHLLMREWAATGRIGLRAFYVRRAFRILPAFYSLIAVVGLLAWWGLSDATPRELGHAATFTYFYNAHFWHWPLAHAWSLSVEEQFYLVWPIALLRLGPRRAGWLATAMIVLMPFARSASAWHVPLIVRDVCYHVASGRVDLLMFGCIAGLHFPAIRSLIAHHRRPAIALCSTLAIAAVTVASILGPLFPLATSSLAFVMFADTAIGLGIIAGLLYVVVVPSCLIGRGLNLRFVAWIGIISYSLYLWQQLFLTVKPRHAWERLPQSVPLALAAGVLSFYLIERPMNRRRRGLLRDRSPLPLGEG